MLKKSLWSDVPDFNFLISTTWSDASSIWMKLYSIYDISMVSECIDLWFFTYIPQFDSLIITSWDYKAGIWRKLSWLNPISMSWNRELKSPVTNIEHLKHFIIWSRKQVLTIRREVDTPNRTRMRFYHRWMSLHWILPKTNSWIRRSRCNLWPSRVNTNWVNCSFMTYKSKRSQLRFKVPHHNWSILWGRHALLSNILSRYLTD